MEYCIEKYLPYTLHMIKTNKFKTVSVKVVFSSAIKKEEITIKNFLADILTYSTKKYKTNKEMSIALQDLYAMNIFSNCYRIGKFYNMDISASFLNEKYTESGLFEESIKALSEVIFNPNVNNKEFDKNSFDIIKRMTFNQIQGINENTRKLSLIKMLEHMGKNEVYSYHSFGYLDDLNKINPSNLYEYYKKVINTSKVDIFILGDIDFNKTKNIIEENFKFNTVKMKKDEFITYHDKFRKTPKKIVEECNISQSKLSIGCKIGMLDDFDRNYVLPLYSIILGGGSDSKLFKEVREKNSLCYYISASANKLDSILFITSGISYNNFDKTVKLTKKAIKDMKKGIFTEEDLKKAKVQYITMLEELKENPFQIISSYYSMEILNYDSISKRKEKILSVTYEQIKQLADKVYIDTIYLLKGEE